jgi:ribosome biogenesis GTPase
MRPRFNEDDPRDEVRVRARPVGGKKSVHCRRKILPPEEGNGTVTEIFPNQSAVLLDGAARPVLCGYRMSTLAFGAVNRERSPVCAGDRVRVEAGVVMGRCERRNQLVRPAPNARNPLLHVLAANLDRLVIVAAAREPEFSAGIVDRFLVAASAQKIPQVLCVNKMDLLASDAARPWFCYPTAGVTVTETSACDGRGTDLLAALLRGEVVAFCGQSGVGKTSLLRRLLGDENYGRTGIINKKSDKGRHTTSGAVMVPGPGGSCLIDTPGVMNFGLIGMKRSELLVHFPELHAAAARCGANCAHSDEPSCGLRALPRYASYLAIKNSLA